MNINPKPIIIGAADGTTRYFNGRMDDIRIYNKALSEDEVKKSMTALEQQATDPRRKLTLTWGRIKVSRQNKQSALGSRGINIFIKTEIHYSIRF